VGGVLTGRVYELGEPEHVESEKRKMTHATIYHVSATTMAVEFDYDKDLKEAIAAMVGSEWDKPSKRWLLPISRLGDEPSSSRCLSLLWCEAHRLWNGPDQKRS